MAWGYAKITGMMSVDPWYSFCGIQVQGYVREEIEKMAKEKQQ